MKEQTIKVELTLDEVNFLLAGYANTVGCAEPDPREDDEHRIYLEGGYGPGVEEHIEELEEEWDWRYAFKKKLNRWHRRLEKKERA